MEFIEGLLRSRQTSVPSPKPPVASTLLIPTTEFTAPYHLEVSPLSFLHLPFHTLVKAVLQEVRSVEWELGYV